MPRADQETGLTEGGPGTARPRKPMHLDLELVSSFIALVDEWHYGRAAETLHLSASALTKRVQHLERQVGCALVERGPDGVTGLTAAGLSFATAARPLLAHARAAADVARAAPASDTLRVGVPAGADAFLRLLDLHAVERQLRQVFPPVRVAFLDVPFPLTSRCLPEHQVDVLFTIIPVRHRDVESFRLPLNSARIGVISAQHPLADVGELDVALFCEHPLLYNPEVPGEWMSQFWLGDIRPRREARLVATHTANNHGVRRDALAGTVAFVTLEPDRKRLPRGLQAVTLLGADPLSFYAARRKGDRSGLAHTYIRLLHAGGVVAQS
jgi:DNA-binding transcriptional LysR family regulator